jgi:phosphate acetyltransferase
MPRVAILSEVETVSTNSPASSDAAAVGKRADLGQITGGGLDGPGLASDHAPILADFGAGDYRSAP